MLKLGVLVSGSGTNLQSILDAIARGSLGASVRVVISNKPGVRALERAASAGVATELVEHKAFASREAFDTHLVARLRAHDVDTVVLAGFMRIVTPVLLEAFPSRIVNIHPSLLPAFPGVDAQAQAWARGVRVTGCTVHFVDAGTDTGAIIAQAAVPIVDGDSAESVRLRILAAEHRLLPAVLQWLAEGRVHLEHGRVRIDAAPGAFEAFSPTLPEGSAAG